MIKVASRHKDYRKANLARIKEREKKYREAHKEEIRARKRTHREANREMDKARLKKWCAANREKIREHRKRDYEKKGRARWLRKKYGISLTDYNSLLAKQGGRCAICRNSETNGKDFAVDHNHIDGYVRGLLCGMCNRGIGIFRDSPTILAAATAYVEKHSQLKLEVKP